MKKNKERAAILLTGNTGYIGTVMTRYLKTSYRIVGLDNDLFKNNIFFPLRPCERPHKQITKDVRHVQEGDLDGIDAVIHLAGLSNDPLGEINPKLTDEINCAATLRLAEIAKRKGVERFIFSSSCSIYGISKEDSSVGENGSVNPLTAYAKAKVDAESALMTLADDNFHPVFMRNATVYGLSPKLRLDLVVNNLAAWAYLTGEITIMSDGTPWRPIIHIQDLCNAFKAVLDAPIEYIDCQSFNVGLDDENYQVRDIAYKIQKFLPSAKVKILNNTGSDERSYRVDFSKIKKTLPSFTPRWNVEKGIEEMLNAYRVHGLSSQDFESNKYFRIRAIRTLLESEKLDKELLWRRW